eukprot:803508-Rhodomonas_salina.3
MLRHAALARAEWWRVQRGHRDQLGRGPASRKKRRGVGLLLHQRHRPRHSRAPQGFETPNPKP